MQKLKENSLFKVDGIDHIHVNVSDRSAAEEWYAKVFGFFRTRDLEFWAKDGGPLTIQNEPGSVHLALFESRDIQNTIVAFKVSADNFRACISQLSLFGITVKPVDHDVSWSIYFKDPDGNPYEVTTYDYAEFIK